jgi:hypothetical protein
MADVQDVLNTLATTVAGILYPNGTGGGSVTGSPIKVMTGWPVPNILQTDLSAGTSHVSVFESPGSERNTTRYAPKGHVMSIAPATITLAAVGRALTVGGAMPSPFTPENVAVIVEGQAFIYPIQPTDTLTSIATGLSSLIAVEFPGTISSGAVITLPVGVSAQAARVGTTGIVTTEWERQEQLFQITVWAPDSPTRATIGAAIKAALAQINFLTMIDGFGARCRYKSSRLSDEVQNAAVYRRDLFYTVEYATTVTEQVATVVAVTTTYETEAGTPILIRSY